jgi:transposase
MVNTDVIKQISIKYSALSPYLSEKGRRIWAATEAQSLGYGGISAIATATGISRQTIHSGVHNLEFDPIDNMRNRSPGGGRKSIVEKNPNILYELEKLLEPATRGDPESALRWTCKSIQNLSDELKRKGYKISPRSVCNLLADLGYSLQSNNKRYEGTNHPDRDKQFKYIYNKVKKFQKALNPIISVDAKKKELVGLYKNNGKEWHAKGTPESVNVYDFPDPKIPKAAPYGVYDVSLNEGWVSVGISHDTAEFAVATIAKWWKKMGFKRYHNATELFITSDSGGSNSNRSKLWKAELQNFSDKTGLKIHVSHFPPGTSKWNNIEHKMFNFISINWRGRPLTTLNVIVNLIGNTTTKEGLEIMAELDENTYEKGIKISKEEMEAIHLVKAKFHGEWNYIISPRRKYRK